MTRLRILEPQERTPEQSTALAAVGELLLRVHDRQIKKSPDRDNGTGDDDTTKGEPWHPPR